MAIREMLGDWLADELAAVKDGSEWTFGIADVLSGRRVVFVGDRPIPVKESAIVLRGCFKKEAGKLIGERFKSRDAARDALDKFRVPTKEPELCQVMPKDTPNP